MPVGLVFLTFPCSFESITSPGNIFQSVADLIYKKVTLNFACSFQTVISHGSIFQSVVDLMFKKIL